MPDKTARMTRKANTARKPYSVRVESGDRRRKQMLAWMESRRAPVQGGELAQHFRVSRQCVVQDIAILRAAGNLAAREWLYPAFSMSYDFRKAEIKMPMRKAWVP